MNCRRCGAKLIQERLARLCPKRDGSEEGQWHDVYSKEGKAWVDGTPTPKLTIEERLAEVERRLGIV